MIFQFRIKKSIFRDNNLSNTQEILEKLTQIPIYINDEKIKTK